MGDPKKLKRKYKTPSHPWQASRIEEERQLLKDYGLKNKKEIWKMTSILNQFREQAKNLIRRSDKQAEKEKKLFLDKLVRLNLLSQDSTIGSVLDLKVNDILERRLQTLVFRKGLAKSVKQARQFIIHRHVTVNGEVVSVPSYFVKVNEEDKIEFRGSSALSDPEHPERVIKERKVEEVADAEPVASEKDKSEEVVAENEN